MAGVFSIFTTFVMGLLLHIAVGQIPPELSPCVNSFFRGQTGDADLCCHTDVIEGITGMMDDPLSGGIIRGVIRPLINLCCLGEFPSLEPVCCTSALIFFQSSPALDICCGPDIILDQEGRCCNTPDGTAPLCPCFDPEQIRENIGECCSIPEYDNNLFAECCATPTYGLVQIEQCCVKPSFEGTTGSEVANCCSTPQQVQEFPACCALSPFPETGTDNFIAGCCRSPQEYAERTECCDTQSFNTDQLANCCANPLLATHEERCCNEYYADLPNQSVCNAYLTAQCTANAQGGAAAPGQDFNYALCCNNPQLPSSGTAWEFDCLYLECIASFIEEECCIVPLINAPFSDQCPEWSPCEQNFDLESCCNDETIADNIEVCCYAAPYTLPSQIATCCSQENIDDWTSTCCRRDMNTELIGPPLEQCCTADRISTHLEFCCLYFFFEDQTVCENFIPNHCIGTWTNPDFDYEICCQHPYVPYLGNSWQIDCFSVECGIVFNPQLCCIPIFEELPFYPQCFPPAPCDEDFDATRCCNDVDIGGNEAICCSAGPGPNGMYELPSQITRCCSPGAMLDENMSRCCSVDMERDLLLSALPQCCSSEYISENYELCCGTIFDQYTAACNQILAAQCAANAQGGAAAPGPNFDAAVCCRNPGIPSAGSAWEFDCLYLECTTAFNDAACCVPQLANAPFAAQCPPPSTCVTNFDVNACCSATEIANNVPICCAAGPNPNGLYELPSQIASCCAAGTAFDGNILRCCSTEISDALVTPVLPRCCSAEHILTNYDLCCDTFFDEYSTECNQILASRCAANAQGGVIAPGPNFDAGVCCGNPAIPSAGSLWEYDCLYLECSTAFDPAACCVSQFTNAPFASQCPPPTTCVTNFDVNTCCSASQIGNNIPICCAAGPQADGVYALPSQIATCCAAGIPFDGNILRCCSPQLDAGLALSMQEQCCAPTQITANAAFCCVLFYDDYTSECGDLASQCSAAANGGTAIPSPTFNDRFCCNNPNLPSAGTPWELDCVYVGCLATFVEETCCIDALNPSTTPWAEDCENIRPPPPPPPPPPPLPPPTNGSCSNVMMNAQNLTFSNISTTGDITFNVGLVASEGRPMRRIRQVRNRR